MSVGAAVFGAVIGAALTVAFFFIFQPRLRRYVWPEPPPASVEPPAPLPSPPQPEPQLGNVEREPLEWDDAEELLGPAYFPDRSPPVTRFEDFNRRLIIVEAGDPLFETERLPPRAFNDFATVLKARGDGWSELVRRELRRSYPLIIDRGGLFAQASQRLEREPYFSDWLTEAYLAIPESRRPAAVSLRNSNAGAGVLTFARHGFKDYHLPTHFLNIAPQASFGHALEIFIGERSGWLWFSPARLRKHIVDLVRREEYERAQMAKLDSPLTVRTKLVEVLHSNDFSALWNLRDTRLAAPEDDAAPSTPAEQAAATSGA